MFALGGRAETDDFSDSTYFAVRGALAKTVTEAALGTSESEVCWKRADQSRYAWLLRSRHALELSFPRRRPRKPFQ